MVTIATPLPISYRQGQPGIALNCSSLSRNALWESVGDQNRHAGVLVPRAGVDTIQPYTTYTPSNRTQNVSVRVYDAARPTWTNVTSGLVFDPANDEISYPSGANSYHGATGTEICASGDCFIESCVKGNFNNRGFGLSAAPHDYSWASPNFDYAIALGQVGAASLWIQGTSVAGGFSGAPPVKYNLDDVFRIGVESGKVCFRLNGELIYQHSPAVAPTNLQPLVSFYEPGTKLWQARFWQSAYGKDQLSATMKVWATMPICQDKLSEHEVLEVAEVSEAEAQRGQDKVVRYHQQQDKWDLIFSGRRFSELQTMRDFRAHHRLHIPFYMTDTARDLEKLVVFDTGIKDRLIQSNMFDFSCTVKEY